MKLSPFIVSAAAIAFFIVAACSDGDNRPEVGRPSGGDADGDADNDADSDADTDSDSDIDADTDSDSDSDTDSDADSDGDSDADADADSDADADADSDADADGDTEEVKEEICDALGNCWCLRLAVIGTAENSVEVTDTSAFVDWLNTSSSCYVTMHARKPTLDAEFFKELDIIIFQHLADGPFDPYWQFSSAEITALKEWVEEGNGVISVTGFNGVREQEETAAINAVMEPISGISYNADQYLTGGCEECWCWGNTVPVYGWDPLHEISSDIHQIGVNWGYSLNAPAGADVVATEDGKTAAAAVSVGEGRVFAFCDEWVLYNEQWRDGETNPTPGDDPADYNICYDMENELFKNAENYFQIPQFWYNVIKWVAPPNDCFVIDDPVIVV